MWEEAKGSGETVLPMPTVSLAFSADGVRPVGLTWNPLKIDPCVETEKAHVYKLS